MLKANKSISLSGSSMIGDKSVVYMAANISTTGGTTSHTTSIQDYAAYEENKTECRADMEEFDQMVYAIEDSMSSEESKPEESK